MLDSHIDRTIETLNAIRTLAPEAKRAVEMMAECLSNGGKILMCGNGGSAAEAAHFATELLCRFERDRPSLPAINLCADGSFLTATGNDYDFTAIFSRQVDGLGKKGDMLVGFTTSGNSKNVIRAMDAAHVRGMKVLAFLGRDGGDALRHADVALTVPGTATAPIQEAHQVLLHYLCGELEQVMFPGMRRSA